MPRSPVAHVPACPFEAQWGDGHLRTWRGQAGALGPARVVSRGWGWHLPPPSFRHCFVFSWETWGFSPGLTWFLSVPQAGQDSLWVPEQGSRFTSPAIDEQEHGPIRCWFMKPAGVQGSCCWELAGTGFLLLAFSGHLCPGTETRPSAWGTFSFLLWGGKN